MESSKGFFRGSSGSKYVYLFVHSETWRNDDLQFGEHKFVAVFLVQMSWEKTINLNKKTCCFLNNQLLNCLDLPRHLTNIDKQDFVT